MRFDTRSEHGRRRWHACQRVYRTHAPAAPPRDGGARVLLSAFGPFDEHAVNASGSLVCRLVPGLAAKPVSPTSVAARDARLAVGSRDVAARGLLLPTAWDLAAALLVKEIDVFEPHLVLMNGIARPRGPLVLETGALNHASVRSDVMGLIPLEPRVTSVAEREVSLALPWEVVEDAARAKLAEPRAHADILTGVERGVPRESNGFVCNATAFLVGLAMDEPGRVVHVLESSHEPDRVELVLRRDYRRTPRGFLHWPSELSRGGAAAAAGVLVELIRATLDAELQSDEASPAHEQD